MSDDDAAARPGSHGTESSRPRPQYGEYASPEEQRARIQQPAPEWQQPVTPPTPVVTDAADAGIPSAAPRAERVVGAAPRPRTVDRVVTIALLVYGLFNVVTSIPSFLDYAAYADTMFTVLGLDVTLSDPAAGRPYGIAAAVVLAAGWLATALVSLWSMRRGRLTWWIPLSAGILFTFVTGILLAIPLMSDPAVLDALMGSAGA
ncbi:hypothetical protein IF188_11660 [Microbacterium sp. NEAU-LLC]|uniref:Uncharacterized protein n=1 Tax=Microbacterium helvum TaxID=2773713 RepID=A0ABR8NNZ3_9MICO|nr:DUF6264 family protein [Microbacterium helvum]MBD3942355.1 hypothetical protein [Microbacterium helvum]